MVTGFHVHRGALASLGRLPLPPVADILTGARRVVVLEDLVDHANVGAVFRAGAALGMDAVLLSPGAPTRSIAGRQGVHGGRAVGPARQDDPVV